MSRRSAFATFFATFALSAFAACGKPRSPDAFGNFEATEVVVSSQAAGPLRRFAVTEGVTLAADSVVGIVDTTPLALERSTSQATRAATTARVQAAERQIAVYESQLAVARRALDRAQRLFDQKAATAQQRDQAERDYDLLIAQRDAARAQQQSVSRDVIAADAHTAQIDDRIDRSRIINPLAGTVLAIYARAGEMVQTGQALYRIANLDTLVLRAYVAETQLALVTIGQRVQVHIDQDNGRVLQLPGTISWVASKAEFTPTPIQTRDERANLVYAVKVLVANSGGVLKIGMPADIELGGVSNRVSGGATGGPPKGP